MIVDRIKRHNIINGFKFSFVEFALIALLIGGFGIYALVLGKLPIGIVGVGIAANCAPVMFYSFRSLISKDKSIGFMNWLDGKGRSSIAKRYPETSVDTLVIVLATLIPFLALILTFGDVMQRKTKRRSLANRR